MSEGRHQAEPLRILTIDNGGLQALSILRTLKQVCQQIAAEQNQEGWKAPHELFDIIAGIGTGGWLAILLGRYKLDIDQCMAIYIRIANAIIPKRRQSNMPKQSANPVAICQSKLIEEVDNIVEEYGLDQYLADNTESSSREERRCFAFAVGITKGIPDKEPYTYHLFRTYSAPEGVHTNDPNPYECRISAACAATAAAKYFMQEYKMGNTVYWDEDFPNTHNISTLALDEASRLFDSTRPLSVVLNVGPGLPTPRQIRNLRRWANNNATTSYKVKDRFRRALSAVTTRDLIKGQSQSTEDVGQDFSPVPPARSSTDPGSHIGKPRRSTTSSSASSVSSRARAEESKHQENIRQRIWHDYQQKTIYHRLAYEATKSDDSRPLPNPYLDDIERPIEAAEVIDRFLSKPTPAATIDAVAKNWSHGYSQTQPQPIVTDRTMSESPDEEMVPTSFEWASGAARPPTTGKESNLGSDHNNVSNSGSDIPNIAVPVHS